MYPTLAAKAAYLFIHIASGHIFSNGNKRTAALCLDTFLLVNSQYLTLSNTEVHDIAQAVASFGERGESFDNILAKTTETISKNMVPLSVFRKINPTAYRSLHKQKRQFRNSPTNQIDAPLAQRW